MNLPHPVFNMDSPGGPVQRPCYPPHPNFSMGPRPLWGPMQRQFLYPPRPCPPGYNGNRYRAPGGAPGHSTTRHWTPTRGAMRMKVDKRDLPENNNFYCDTCDRGYKMEDKYKEHVNSHVSCHYADCSYVAASKLVQLHIAQQHRTGLAKKIWVLSKDVEKWREERKKNFPTSANIARKRALVMERRARGEILETQRFGKMQQRNRNRGRNNIPQKRGRRKLQGQYPCTGTEKAQSKNSDIPDDVTAKKNPTEDPLSYILTGSDSDEPPEELTTTIPAKEVKAAGGLGSLMSSYGDMSDSEDEDEQKRKQVPSSPVIQQTERKQHRRSPYQHPNNSTQARSILNNLQYVNPRQKPTLLQKLLASEIRHERNVILQCVRYITKNNFFGTSTHKLVSNTTAGITTATSSNNTQNTEDEEIW